MIALGLLTLAGVAVVPMAMASCPPSGNAYAGYCSNGDGTGTYYACALDHCQTIYATYCDSTPPCDTSGQYFCIGGLVYFTYGADGQSPRVGVKC